MTALLGVQPPEWTRDDWLRWRVEGIGGSDVAALCGLSRFASPMSVFVDKCDLGTPREVGEAAAWGQLLEGPIAREFEARTGLHVLFPQALAVDAGAPWRRCTLDGLVAESADVPLDELGAFLGTCQIKCSSAFGFDDLPDEYEAQVQWEMGITGLGYAWVPVLHQGRRLEVYERDFDARAYAALCSIVDRFWHEHVKVQTPPAADGSEATTVALKAAYSETTGKHVLLDEGLVDVALAWPPAKQRVKDAQVELGRIENELRAALGEAVAGAVTSDDGPVELVTWKPQNAGARIDTKRLRAERPDIWAEFTPPAGTTRVLRSTKALLELLGEQQDTNEGANL